MRGWVGGLKQVRAEGPVAGKRSKVTL